MKTRRRHCAVIILLVCGLAAATSLRAADVKVLYTNDFEQAALDSLPDGFREAQGDFAVKQSGGNKVLEAPSSPADQYFVLFGPVTNSGVVVTARVSGTSKGRRMPSFGIGLNGGAGFRLVASPAKGNLEIYKGDTSMATAPLEWKTGSWTLMRLRVRAEGGQKWKIDGKAWVEGLPEPKDWMIATEDTTEPPAGRASLWATPYSGTPLWFDDVSVTTSED